MRIKIDTVEEWLKENDPEYSTNKYYLNNRRFRTVQEWEKPIPNNKMDKTGRRACV